MAKPIIILANFIALALLVNASTYQATTIVVDENDANVYCRDQVQRQQYLRHCQNYISRQISGLGLSHGYNPQLRQCCNHIRSMQVQCRCIGLLMAIDQQMSRGQIQRHESLHAYRLAQDLPYMCGVSPRQCHFGWWWGF